MRYSVRQVQQALNDNHGFSLVVDGINGPNTEAAISELKGRNGLRRRPKIGPLTEALIFGEDKRVPTARKGDHRMPPWLNEMGKYLWKHETKNNALLRKWLRSDGKTLGDPASLPWCGDCMETAIKLTLPKEPFPGPLGQNPYWARNWVHLGEATNLRLGAMVVVKRGRGGHICSAIGYDPKRKRIRVRGGNQSNAVTDTWISENRLLGYKSGMNILRSNVDGLRAPTTWKYDLPPIPIMNSRGAVISTNEA